MYVQPNCQPAHYCPFRTPILCPAGYYCPAQYINSAASPGASQCPPGHHCPFGSVQPQSCAERWYCPAMSVQPIPCPAGYYCPAQSDDPTVGFCESSTTHNCSAICPLGSYCPYMSATHVPCPEFTYGDQLGLSSKSCSGQCANGTYWDAPGQQSANCSGVCELGQYCPYKARQSLPCPGGSYCPNTTTLLSCTPGYYGAELELTDPHCSGPCAAGFMCTENSITARQLPCPPGHYSNQTGQGSCSACPPGSFAESSMNGTTACTECPTGQYSPDPGASRCLPCVPGTYGMLPGMSRCNQCRPGSYSKFPASNESLGITGCEYCPRGQYSPAAGAAACLTCPVGQYTDSPGRDVCVMCAAGYTTDANPANYHIECVACPLGQFSLPGGLCEPCPRTTYSLLPGTADCLPCGGIAGVQCEGGIAFVDKAYHAVVEVRCSSSNWPKQYKVDVALNTQRCPDGYCVGVNSSVFNDVVSDAMAAGRMMDNRSDAVAFSLPQQCSSYRDQSSASPLCGGCQPRLCTIRRRLTALGLCAM